MLAESVLTKLYPYARRHESKQVIDHREEVEGSFCGEAEEVLGVEVVGEHRVHKVLADEVTEVNEQAANCINTVIVYILDPLEL